MALCCEPGVINTPQRPYKDCKKRLSTGTKWYRKLLGSAFRLVFIPFKDFWFIPPALIFNLIAILWLFANTIITWINTTFGSSIGPIPTFDAFWTGVVLGVFAFFVFGTFSLAISKFRGGYAAFRALNNSIVTTMNNIGSALDYDQCDEEDLVLISEIHHLLRGYTYAIKNSFRSILIAELIPVPTYLQCEIITYGHPHSSRCNGRAKVLTANDLRNFEFKKGRKTEVNRSDIYLEAIYHMIRLRYTKLIRRKRLPPQYHGILSGETGNVNTLIGAIGNGGAIPTPPGLTEILMASMVFYFGLLPPILFQIYPTFWAFVFYNIFLYIVLGTILYVMEVSNPFLDPEDNLFLGTSSTVGVDANNTAHLVDMNAEQIYKNCGEYTMNYKDGMITKSECAKKQKKKMEKLLVFDSN